MGRAMKGNYFAWDISSPNPLTQSAKSNPIRPAVFEDEGHDVLKYENRVRCYNAIADFFAEHLKP